MKHFDYSIIICTYNPDERILKRCLDAVCNLDTTGISVEVLLTDNNSDMPLKDMPLVKDFIDKNSNTKLLEVLQQGVKYARMAAINAASGKYVLYIDYDNEPQKNYLQALQQLHTQYPQVAAWGPGNVYVDFIDGISKQIEQYARIAFQEKHQKAVLFSDQREWQTCYPFGTGLCADTALLKEYIDWSNNGQFSLTGRNGNKLTSGEDTQMVLLCVKKGFFAGTSPTLQLNHIIPSARANSQYLKRLAYGTSVCYDTCIIEVFPEFKNALYKKIIPASKFARQSTKKFLWAKVNSDPHKIFELANFIGRNVSAYQALNKPVPALIKRITRHLKLE